MLAWCRLLPCLCTALGVLLAHCLTTPCTAVQLLDDPLSAVDPRVGRILFDQCIGNSGIMAGEMTGQQRKHALAACLAWRASTERSVAEPCWRADCCRRR